MPKNGVVTVEFPPEYKWSLLDMGSSCSVRGFTDL